MNADTAALTAADLGTPSTICVGLCVSRMFHRSRAALSHFARSYQSGHARVIKPDVLGGDDVQHAQRTHALHTSGGHASQASSDHHQRARPRSTPRMQRSGRTVQRAVGGGVSLPGVRAGSRLHRRVRVLPHDNTRDPAVNAACHDVGGKRRGGMMRNRDAGVAVRVDRASYSGPLLPVAKSKQRRRGGDGGHECGMSPGVK